jgi:hypothetical protein
MLEFGLIGDADALPDLERIAQFLDEAIDELLTTARRHRGAKKKDKAAKRGRTDSRRAGGRP